MAAWIIRPFGVPKIRQNGSSGRPRSAGAALAGVHAPQEQILHMKTTLKLKINMSREYLGLFIYPQKPSAGLPNLVRLSL
jgi:hypothetical protein